MALICSHSSSEFRCALQELQVLRSQLETLGSVRGVAPEWIASARAAAATPATCIEEGHDEIRSEPQCGTETPSQEALAQELVRELEALELALVEERQRGAQIEEERDAAADAHRRDVAELEDMFMQMFAENECLQAENRRLKGAQQCGGAAMGRSRELDKGTATKARDSDAILVAHDKLKAVCGVTSPALSSRTASEPEMERSTQSLNLDLSFVLEPLSVDVGAAGDAESLPRSAPINPPQAKLPLSDDAEHLASAPQTSSAMREAQPTQVIFCESGVATCN